MRPAPSPCAGVRIQSSSSEAWRASLQQLLGPVERVPHLPEVGGLALLLRDAAGAAPAVHLFWRQPHQAHQHLVFIKGSEPRRFVSRAVASCSADLEVQPQSMLGPLPVPPCLSQARWDCGAFAVWFVCSAAVVVAE
eukprot:289127-Chlamydomonas_euryale.AAC.2